MLLFELCFIYWLIDWLLNSIFRLHNQRTYVQVLWLCHYLNKHSNASTLFITVTYRTTKLSGIEKRVGLVSQTQYEQLKPMLTSLYSQTPQALLLGKSTGSKLEFCCSYSGHYSHYYTLVIYILSPRIRDIKL